MVGGIVGIDADGQHDDSFIFHASLHANQRWSLFDARRTPGRPEIQHHDLTAKLAERDGMVGILHGEVRGVGSDAGGVIAAVASD